MARAANGDSLGGSYGNVRIEPLPEASRNEISNSALRSNKFDYALLESIDDALADLLGRRSRDQIYDHLATRYGCGRDEIPIKVYEFHEFLEKVFSSGAKTVCRTIIRRLCAKLGYEFVSIPDFEFFDYLAVLRAKLERDEESRERASQPSFIGPWLRRIRGANSVQ